MNFKRTFTIHLDAVLVLAILFIGSLAFNYYQQKQVEELGWKVFSHEMKLLENDLNLSSQKHFIEKLQRECGEELVEPTEHQVHPDN